MCFGDVALKEGGGIFWFESFRTQAKIASLAKVTYPAFKTHGLGLHSVEHVHNAERKFMLATETPFKLL